MFDLLIQNGMVLDGSGEAGFSADIGILNGKIAAIGKNLGEARQVLDATGLTVTPGFIDSHSHSDSQVLTFPAQREKVEQGITTSVGGQCGASLYPAVKNGGIVPMGAFLQQAAATPQGSNIAMFVGHSIVRKAVMGMENRAPTEEELETMKDLLREAMDAGAMGISFGLVYTPGGYADTDELIALARVAKEKGGMISAHIRDESDGVIEAVEEFITVAKAADIRGVVSHHKAACSQNHGKVKTTLQMLEKANRKGCDIYCDVYPYTASRTRLAARFIPKEYVNNHLSEYLKDPGLRDRFRKYAVGVYGENADCVLIQDCTAYPQYTGLRLPEAAKLHGKDVWETLFDILEKQPGCYACYFTMCEEDVKTVMAWERAMICTDSGVAGTLQTYHPRLRASFPRVLGRYVREEKVICLPEMIRKMTALPAKVYDLKGKGSIRVDYDGDLCVFDAETILDRADYADPARKSEGLRWVIVGGQIVAENGACTGKTPGKVLLRK